MYLKMLDWLAHVILYRNLCTTQKKMHATPFTPASVIQYYNLQCYNFLHRMYLLIEIKYFDTFIHIVGKNIHKK